MRVHLLCGTSCHVSVLISQSIALALNISAPNLDNVIYLLNELLLSPTHCDQTKLCFEFPRPIILLHLGLILFSLTERIRLSLLGSCYVRLSPQKSSDIVFVAFSSKWLLLTSTSFSSSVLCSYTNMQ